MTSLLTGMNGTVAPVVARHLQSLGHQIVAWDRSRVSPDDLEGTKRFIREVKPDWCFHIAMGNPVWAEEIARTCAEDGIPFLFTGTVSVFSNNVAAPIPVSTPADAEDDYGRYKRECEERIARVNPDAIIARIAWQIGDAPGSNNMIDYLHKQAAEHGGEIPVSTHWIPACAFLEDTAEALCGLMERCAKGGVYHLDGNPGLSMFEIASKLNALHGDRWKIIPAETPVQDNRMAETRLRVPPITARFD